MFIVLLRFSNQRSQVAQHLAGHKAWLQSAHAEGIFLLSGSLVPGLGGAILAHGLTREALEQRLTADPFVAADVVSVEIIEIAPAQMDQRLRAVLEAAKPA